MPWTPTQTMLAHIVQKHLCFNREQYLLLLRNVAGIRPYAGEISSKNPSANNAGFERFMAFAEGEGFVDSKNGAGYWRDKARQTTLRVHNKIQALWAQAAGAQLVSADGLPGFVMRQTHSRPEGPTENLAECDPTWSSKVLEGVKAFLFPLARKHNVDLDF